MSRRANYHILVKDEPDGPGYSPGRERPLVIRDVGPWDEHLTVTNDAERVVEDLIFQGLLPPGRRLIYYDSEGELTETLIENGKFVGFGLVKNEEGDTA
jgi:hypothetical protein